MMMVNQVSYFRILKPFIPRGINHAIYAVTVYESCGLFPGKLGFP